MKPIRLEMTAFGSYAERTVIEFDKFESQLYLITGDTGAGKTTIFDAIMIALFGEASGKPESGKETKAKARSFECLHSDFVGMDVESIVRLEFLHGGKIYTAERRLRFTKSRGGGYGKANKTANLWEPGKEVLEGDSRVTDRIAEIIGMDGSKFRKIIMLAQGEFNKFLRANPEEKGKILGDLFDSSPYVYYQTLLDNVRERLELSRAEETGIITNALAEFEKPEDAGEEFLAGHSGLLASLETLTKKNRETAEALAGKVKQAQEDLGKITSEATLAERNNQDLGDLEKKKIHLQELEDKKQVMEELRRKTETVANAHRFVCPAEKNRAQAEKDLKDLKENIVRLEEVQREQAEKVTAAQTEVEKDQPKQTERDTLNTEASKIRDTLEDYRNIEKAQEEQKRLAEEIEKKKTEAIEAEKEQQRLTAEIVTLEEEEQTLQGIDAEAARAENRMHDREKNLALLQDPDRGLYAQCRVISEKENKRKTLTEEALCLNRVMQDDFHVYKDLNERHLSGQAGILAGKLGKKLEEEGEACCPVCGCQLKKSDRAHLCAKTEDTPSEETVKEAFDRYQESEAAAKEKAAEAGRAETQLNGLKENAVRDGKELEEGCDSWEILSAPEYLPELEEVLEKNVREAKDLLDACKKKQKRLKTVRELIKKDRTEGEAARRKKETAQTEANDLETQRRAAETTVETLKPKLLFESEKEAEKACEEKETRARSLDAEIIAHRRDLDKAQEDRNRTDGALRENREKLPVEEERLEKRKLELEKTLQEHGFASAEEAAGLLAPIREEGNIEDWIRRKEKEQSDYSNDKANTAQSIAELEEKTKGCEFLDLEAIKACLQEAKDRQTDAINEEGAFRITAQNHQKTYERVKGAKEALAVTDGAFARISRLAALAAGTENAEGGRLSFERYVMGGVFREILDMANRRLDLMTGGKYELKHVIGGAGASSQTGFGIHVLDHMTGKERPSETLSGGESFMASLSLALGLSDVVQNRAGGIQLDSLYIDEGFGSLDEGVLDKAIRVLEQLTTGNRLVGVISHVPKLDESIPTKIIVRSSDRGSTIDIRN